MKPHLPGQKGQRGGIADDNREFVNTVFWIVCTDVEGFTDRLWEPEQCRQKILSLGEKRIAGTTLESIDEPDFVWLMIDVSHINVRTRSNVSFQD